MGRIALVLYIPIAIVIIIAVALIYRALYQRRINKQLHGETLSARKMPSPRAFALLTAFVVLIAFAGIITYLALSDYGADKIPEEYRNALYSYQSYSPSQMTGYRQRYSIQENPGYTKTTEQQGDIKFTIFIHDDVFDHYHPSFIVYAEYTGNKSILYYGVQGNFHAPNDCQMTGRGHAGSEFEEYICILGSSDIQSRFELRIHLYDSGLKSEDPEEYAAASGTISIWIPR